MGNCKKNWKVPLQKNYLKIVHNMRTLKNRENMSGFDVFVEGIVRVKQAGRTVYCLMSWVDVSCELHHVMRSPYFAHVFTEAADVAAPSHRDAGSLALARLYGVSDHSRQAISVGGCQQKITVFRQFISLFYPRYPSQPL